MKRVSLANRLTPALLTACLLLGIVLALEWYALPPADRITAGTATQPAAPAQDIEPSRTAYLRPDLKAFGEILERPPFTEGRSPPEQPAPEQPTGGPATPAQLAMRLEGVALTPGARIAVVRDIPTNTLLRLAEGDQHQGWVVENVDATSATLKRGDRTQQLMLELDKTDRPRTTRSRTGRVGRRVNR
jgi:hypothetical protein